MPTPLEQAKQTFSEYTKLYGDQLDAAELAAAVQMADVQATDDQQTRLNALIVRMREARTALRDLTDEFPKIEMLIGWHDFDQAITKLCERLSLAFNWPEDADRGRKFSE